MNNGKRNKLIIIIIALIVVAAAITCVFVLKSNNKEKSNKDNGNAQTTNSTKKVSNNKDITFINPAGGSDNKLAILLDYTTPRYVLTIDYDEKIPFPEDYLEAAYEENSNFEILTDIYGYRFKINDFTVETSYYETKESELKTIKQQDNWYLTQSTLENDDEPNILLKLSDKYSVNWIKCSIFKNGVRKESNSNYFDEIVKHVKTYFIDQDLYDLEKKLSFLDTKGNVVDLSDYTFLNDNIAKSVIKYNLFLRNPIKIFSLKNGSFLDYIPDSNQYYFINIIDKSFYEYYAKELQKYGTKKMNNLNYEIFFDDTYDGEIFVFRPIDNEKYIKIIAKTPFNKIEDRLIDLENELL